MSAAGEPASGVQLLRDVSLGLAPRTRRDGGLRISGSTAAALAELFRQLAREGEPSDVATRAARRLLADLDAAGSAPAPRTPADAGGGVLAAR